MNYKVSKKNGQGKWWSYGSIKKNQYDNLSLGFKVTPELKAIFSEAQEGGWVNFALFEDKPKESESTPASYAAASGTEFVADELDDSIIPF